VRRDKLRELRELDEVWEDGGLRGQPSEGDDEEDREGEEEEREGEEEEREGKEEDSETIAGEVLREEEARAAPSAAMRCTLGEEEEHDRVKRPRRSPRR
jgi:hypothetical protein